MIVRLVYRGQGRSAGSQQRALSISISRDQLSRLADCRWAGYQQDLIITGKMRLRGELLDSALGHQACLHGFRVNYHESSRLFEDLRIVKADGS